MSEPGWFDDPTGRFGRRWFDGANWTASVVGATGAVVADPVPQREDPYPPPTDTARAEPAAAAPYAAPQGYPPQGYQQQGYQQQGYPPPGYPAQGSAPQLHPPQGHPPQGHPLQGHPPQGHPPQGYAPYGPSRGGGGGRYVPGPGIAAGAVGLVCVVLSLFALDWGKGDRAGFLDLSKAVRKAGSGAVDNGGIYYYCAWAGFVLLGLTVVLVVLAGIPVPPTRVGNTYARIVGAVVAGGAAVLQTVAMAEVFKGPGSPQFGAWLGVIGYLVVVVGFVLGARPARA